jgi:hypothetical protein
VQGRYGEIRGLGSEVVVVSFAPPERVAAYLARYPLPFPAVADPERAAYQAFELGRTSWPAMLHPRFVVRYLRLIFGGRLPHRPDEGEDVLQLGGDFVLDSGYRLCYAHRSADPTDRPAADKLVEVVRAVAESLS